MPTYTVAYDEAHAWFGALPLVFTFMFAFMLSVLAAVVASPAGKKMLGSAELTPGTLAIIAGGAFFILGIQDFYVVRRHLAFAEVRKSGAFQTITGVVSNRTVVKHLTFSVATTNFRVSDDMFVPGFSAISSAVQDGQRVRIEYFGSPRCEWICIAKVEVVR